MQTEFALKIITICLSLMLALVLPLLIHLLTPKRWWSNKAKLIGLVVATCGVVLQLGLYLYNHWQGLTPTERIEYREVAEKSQAQACQEAGYLADSYFWDDVHHYFSSHHFYEGSFASRLLCMDEYHLAHEIFPPKCNAHNLKACK